DALVHRERLLGESELHVVRGGVGDLYYAEPFRGRQLERGRNEVVFRRLLRVDVIAGTDAERDRDLKGVSRGHGRRRPGGARRDDALGAACLGECEGGQEYEGEW